MGYWIAGTHVVMMAAFSGFCFIAHFSTEREFRSNIIPMVGIFVMSPASAILTHILRVRGLMTDSTALGFHAGFITVDFAILAIMLYYIVSGYRISVSVRDRHGEDLVARGRVKATRESAIRFVERDANA